MYQAATAMKMTAAIAPRTMPAVVPAFDFPDPDPDPAEGEVVDDPSGGLGELPYGQKLPLAGGNTQIKLSPSGTWTKFACVTD